MNGRCAGLHPAFPDAVVIVDAQGTILQANARAVALWLSFGFEILTTVPEAFRHPTQGFVGLHIMYRRL